MNQLMHHELLVRHDGQSYRVRHSLIQQKSSGGGALSNGDTGAPRACQTHSKEYPQTRRNFMPPILHHYSRFENT